MILRRIVCSFVSGCAIACSSSEPANGTVDLSSPPTAEILCKLAPSRSTLADVRSVLGPPSESQSSEDGTATSLYDYSSRTTPNPMIAILQLWFTKEQVFSTATAFNMDLPGCWNFDGGS